MIIFCDEPPSSLASALTPGNAGENDRVSLFLMGYPDRRRLKLFGHLSFTPAAEAPEAAAALAMPGYPARVDRSARVRIASFD